MSVTFAESLMNFTGIPSGPAALWEINELMILFMSWVAACYKLNMLFCVTDDLMVITPGWSR